MTDLVLAPYRQLPLPPRDVVRQRREFEEAVLGGIRRQGRDLYVLQLPRRRALSKRRVQNHADGVLRDALRRPLEVGNADAHTQRCSIRLRLERQEPQ